MTPLEEFAQELLEKMNEIEGIRVDDNETIIVETVDGLQEMLTSSDDLMLILMASKLKFGFQNHDDSNLFAYIRDYIQMTHFANTNSDDARILKEIASCICDQVPDEGRNLVTSFTNSPPSSMQKNSIPHPRLVIASGAVRTPDELNQFHSSILSVTKNRSRAAELVATVITGKGFAHQIQGYYNDAAASRKTKPETPSI